MFVASMPTTVLDCYKFSTQAPGICPLLQEAVERDMPTGKLVYAMADNYASHKRIGCLLS